jgi:transcriptional repressor NrdR
MDSLSPSFFSISQSGKLPLSKKRDSQKSFNRINRESVQEFRVRCPFCNHEESKVTDSRDAVEINAIRRRRECCQCMKRFTTFETVDLSLQVKKRDGTFEDFQQEKLIHGMDAACRHTRVSHDQVRAIAYKIKSELMAKGVREISSQELGDIVIRQLKDTDVVAYIRFACVYKRFKDVRELLEAIQELKNEETIHAAEEI